MSSWAAAAQPPFGRIIRHARASRRLRLEVPGLLGDELLARRLERSVARREGVASVHADARSGRVLITYHAGATIFDDLEALASGRAPLEPARRPAPSDGPRGFHSLTVAEALARLGSSTDGLSPAEALRRLRVHGRNELSKPIENAWYRILGRQVANLPTALLLGAAAISLILGDVLEASAIVMVLGLNTAIGYAVERRSDALLASWQRLETGSVRVLRAGRVETVPAGDLAPGDVVLCEAGDVLAADARVIESDRLACDEAPLTGESEAQHKGTAPTDPDAPLAERTSMVLAGTVVVAGRGRAVVTATGWHTEVAQIRALLDERQSPKAPVQRRLDELTNRASAVALGAAGLSALAGIARGRPVLAMLRDAVALGVAAIPEGLPLIATAALVNTMGRLRGSGVVVRRVAAAETLGGVTVVCADKTGTLTRNQMKLELVDLGAGPVAANELRAAPADPLGDPATLALAAAVLNSDVDLQGHGEHLTLIGSSTEQALVAAARRAGIDVVALRQAFPRRVLRERQEGISYVTSLHDAPGGGRVAFVKGAPEQVLFLCADASGAPLSEEARAALLERNQRLAAQGLRVLALAWRRVPSAGGDATVPGDGYAFAGLVGLRDPLRDTASRTVEEARRAGIRTLILTGDQSVTAAAIARELGLGGDVLEGSEVSRLLNGGGAEARERLARVSVFSRVTPSDKLAIVRALRASGEVVAMVGDGVNDAPALKAADIGIAVSRGSTDLARQTADVVLEGEDLAAIIEAVAEGRILQDNLHRAVRFLFATNLSEVVLVLGFSLLGAQPLTALQLLWINLLSDTLPALALALEPGHRAVLQRPPVAPGSPFLSRQSWRELARDGALLGGVGAAAFLAGGAPLAFAALPAAQLGYAPVCNAPANRTHGGPEGRRFALLVGGSAALHAAVLTFPPLRAVLRLPPAGARTLAGLAALGLPWAASWARRALASHSPRSPDRP